MLMMMLLTMDIKCVCALVGSWDFRHLIYSITQVCWFDRLTKWQGKVFRWADEWVTSSPTEYNHCCVVCCVKAINFLSEISVQAEGWKGWGK